MSRPIDLSPLQRELDNLRGQLCHCDNAGTCLGCQGLVKQVQEMQEKLLRDPEAAKALEELLKYFQGPPEETNH